MSGANVIHSITDRPKDLAPVFQKKLKKYFQETRREREGPVSSTLSPSCLSLSSALTPRQQTHKTFSEDNKKHSQILRNPTLNILRLTHKTLSD